MNYITVYELTYGATLGQLQNAALGAILFSDVSTTAQQVTCYGHVVSRHCAV